MSGLATSPAPRTSLLQLPREIRDEVLLLALQDAEIFITSWACDCSIFDDGHGSRLMLADDFFESSSRASRRSATTSFDPSACHGRSSTTTFFANTSLFKVCKQLSSESMETIRHAGRYILLITKLPAYPAFIDSCPAGLARRISGFCFADVCSQGHGCNLASIDFLGYCPPRYPLTTKFPLLSSLTIVVRVSLAMANKKFLEVFQTGFLELLRTDIVSDVKVVIGHWKEKETLCFPDAQFEETCLRSRPRQALSPWDFRTYQINQVAHRAQLDSWLQIRRSEHVGPDYCTWGHPKYRVAFTLCRSSESSTNIS